MVAKIENQKPPAPHKQLLPGYASIFTDADGNPTEARAVFIAGTISTEYVCVWGGGECE